MTRRDFLFSLPAAAALPGYAFAVEPEWLERVRHTVRIPGARVNRPVRILQLSDFHLSSCVPLSLVERAITLGLETKPDLICLTGDFITDSQPFDRAGYASALARLSQAAPAFASLGNHDGGSWAAERIGGFPDSKEVRALLGAAGIELLHNSARRLTIHGQPLHLAGLGDIWSEEADPAAAFASLSPQPGVPILLMAHNPDSKDLVKDRPWHLMLSGHTHGGQVLIPLVGTRFVSVRDKRFISGLKNWERRSIYISRGVGNLAGVRFNCRPEVTILDLTS